VGDIDDFQRSTRRAQRRRIAVMAMVIALPFLWLGWRWYQREAEKDRWAAEQRERNRLTPAERTEYDKLIADLHRNLQSASKSFAEDVTPETLEKIAPGDAPCPLNTKSKADEIDADLGTKYALLTEYQIKIFKPGQPPSADNLETAARRLADLEEQNHSGEPQKYDLATARLLASEMSQVMFVVGERTEPAVLADEYIPGAVRGTAFLYSPAQRKIVCAADINVENASEIKVNYMTTTYDPGGSTNKRAAAQSQLGLDLAQRLNRAIAANMRAVR
jgi:hypothetical protein